MPLYGPWPGRPSFERLVKNGSWEPPFESVFEDAVSALDDIAIEHLLLYARDRSDVERAVAAVTRDEIEAPTARDEVVDRIDRYLPARGRSPRSTLGPEDAFELATSYVGELLSGLHQWAGAEPKEDHLRLAEKVIETPIRICVDPSDGSSVAKRFVESGPPPVAGTFGITLWESEQLTAGSSAIESESYSFGHELAPPGFRWEHLFVAAHEACDGSTLLAAYLLEPVAKGPVDPTPAYTLWEHGASLWFSGDAIEVRTYTAQRSPDSPYE